MKFKDYYQTLGVARTATQDEIKKAFRLLARKYHPDVSKEPDAEERFKEVNEAYEVLKDAEKRKAYDQLGSYHSGDEFRPPPGWEHFSYRAGPQGAGHHQFDFSDFFSELFGGAAAGADFGRRDVEAQVEISLEEAAAGTSRSVRFDVPEIDDKGRIHHQTRAFTVRIPAGSSDGQRLKVAGKGGQGGDLYLVIRIRSHPLYRLSGHDLYIEVPLAPWEAALGTSLEVPTLAGRARLKVPHGVRAGQKLRLAGKGLPRPRGEAGDLYAVIQIVTPPELNPREKELFEELARVSTFTPRRNF